MQETVIVAIICGLGSGLIGTFVSGFWAASTEARKRQIEFLQSQLRELYGPLHFFCVQNDELYKVQERLYTVGKEEFGQNVTGNAADRQARTADIHATVDLENCYTAKLRENNKRMAQVIEEKWSFIDEDDREALAEFIVQHIRSETEFDEQHNPKLPLGVSLKIPTPLSYDSKFTNRIDGKWNAKQAKFRRKLKAFLGRES